MLCRRPSSARTPKSAPSAAPALRGQRPAKADRAVARFDLACASQAVAGGLFLHPGDHGAYAGVAIAYD